MPVGTNKIQPAAKRKALMERKRKTSFSLTANGKTEVLKDGTVRLLRSCTMKLSSHRWWAIALRHIELLQQQLAGEAVAVNQLGDQVADDRYAPLIVLRTAEEAVPHEEGTNGVDVRVRLGKLYQAIQLLPADDGIVVGRGFKALTDCADQSEVDVSFAFGGVVLNAPPRSPASSCRPNNQSLPASTLSRSTGVRETLRCT
eukprot:TRINITY_DN19727_c0_g1_i1.p1 TRINITY_DN19727_c0_g1~~TRINITY_DN19727_c0_g1_i1.p1  ORF type:complete len:227 (+),score=2.49 TRINITY_DN19727_c0_g1_i1:79-681(+)